MDYWMRLDSNSGLRRLSPSTATHPIGRQVLPGEQASPASAAFTEPGYFYHTIKRTTSVLSFLLPIKCLALTQLSSKHLSSTSA